MAGTETSAANEDLQRAAIGPRSDYYLAKWRAMDAKGRGYDWNWAACLLNVFWFAYRKMWGPMAAMGLVYVVTSPMLDPNNRLLIKIVAVVLIGLSFVTGSFGNRLYRAKVAGIVAGAASPEAAGKQGGVSWLAAIGAVVGLTVLTSIAGMVAAMVVHR